MFLLSKRKLSLRRFIYQSHTKVYMHNIDHEVYLCYNLKIDLVVNYFGGKPMKREEKNQQTQRRIMDSALAEFAEKGHGGSSVNTICAAQGISKGIIYHYFENKDELYLACVEECFQRLTAHLSAALPEEDDGSVEDQLGRYFTARMTFFQENPVYQPIFCEAVISPPARLFEQIQARRKAFDALTISTLKHLLRQLPLRTDITMEEVVDLFRQFQDFINAQAQASSMPARKCFALRDAQCRRLLTVLLYGVTERGGIDMATKQNSSSILGDINPPKAIIKLALPATLALLAKAVYNIVDTAYIGMLDSDIALTAVGVTVPLLLIMVSIENIFAAGAAVLAGRHLGAKDEEGASRTVTTIIGLSIVIGVVLCVGGIAFIEPLMRVFGASDASLPLAKDYAFWMFVAALANLPAQSMNCAARAESSVKLSSIAVITGALLNVVLDPVFMFDWGLGMGWRGPPWPPPSLSSSPSLSWPGSISVGAPSSSCACAPSTPVGNSSRPSPSSASPQLSSKSACRWPPPSPTSPQPLCRTRTTSLPPTVWSNGWSSSAAMWSWASCKAISQWPPLLLAPETRIGFISRFVSP